MDCAFCRIVNKIKDADIIFEDDVTLVMVDQLHTCKGHLLILSKRHVLNASDLTKDEFLHFAETYQTTEKAILEVLNRTRAVTLKTGGFIPHFHFHLYPVDKDTPWTDIQAMIDRQTRYEYRPGEMEAMIKAVQEKMTQGV